MSCTANERLRAFVAGLDGMTAVEMAQAITHAVLDFSDGHLSDDTVALVMQVPSPEDAARQSARRSPPPRSPFSAGGSLRRRRPPGADLTEAV